MRYDKLIIAMVVFALLAMSSFAVEEGGAEISPEQFITDWADTFNKNDPELQCAFYDRSEEVDVIISAGIHHHGYKAVQKAYADDQQQLQYYDSKSTILSSRILEDTALVTFDHQFKTKFTQDDSCWQVHIRTTSVLHRMDGEWKIVLEHSSPIRGIERFTQIQEVKID